MNTLTLREDSKGLPVDPKQLPVSPERFPVDPKRLSIDSKQLPVSPKQIPVELAAPRRFPVDSFRREDWNRFRDFATGYELPTANEKQNNKLMTKLTIRGKNLLDKNHRLNKISNSELCWTFNVNQFNGCA